MRVIDQICDKVAVLDQSKIAEESRASEVFINPHSEIAKELILPGKKNDFNISCRQVLSAHLL